MYKDLLIKALRQAIKTGCLQEFISMNDVSDIINTSPGNLSLVGTAIMKGDNDDVSILLKHGLIPNDSSRIIVDYNNEFGLRRYYDETYNMEELYKYVPDLVMIAHKCSYDLYTKAIDTAFEDPSRWSIDQLQGLIYSYFDFIELFVPNETECDQTTNHTTNEIVPIDDSSTNEPNSIDEIVSNDDNSMDETDGYIPYIEEPKVTPLDVCFRYLLSTILKHGLFDTVVKTDYIVGHAYELYLKSNNPIVFKILFEYGIDPSVCIRNYPKFTLSQLIDTNPVIGALYRPISITKKAIRASD
jgi:hypothetical protein